MQAAPGFIERLASPGARDLSVFINCPFDDEYASLRDALVFSTVCCGLLPRSAMDLGQVSIPRMRRILTVMAECRYSIHDLMRCGGEGDFNLARFNMPLELGIAIAHQEIAIAQHDWFVLVPNGHRYAEFVSDLGGYDPLPHDGTPDAVVRAAMAWLWTLDPAVQACRPSEVCEALPAFTFAREQLEAEFAGRQPWSLVYEAAVAAVPIP